LPLSSLPQTLAAQTLTDFYNEAAA
jgi:hypothetical protein